MKVKTKATVMIMYKPELPDVHGTGIAKTLRAAGFTEIIEARSGKVIELEINTTGKESVPGMVEQMCKDLLAHPFSETYSIAYSFEAEPVKPKRQRTSKRKK